MNAFGALKGAIRRQKLLWGWKDYFAYEAPKGPWKLLQENKSGESLARKVIHVGAYFAEERLVYEMLGARDILWVEGSPENFRHLRASLHHDRKRGRLHANHQTVLALLSDTPGDVVTLAGFNKEKGSNSIFRATQNYEKAFPGLEQTGRREECVTQTLDDVADQLGFSDATLLVLDIEGAELLALKGGANTLRHARAVILELSDVPLLEGGVLASDMVAWMKAQGFSAVGEIPKPSGNLLFLRDS